MKQICFVKCAVNRYMICRMAKSSFICLADHPIIFITPNLFWYLDCIHEHDIWKSTNTIIENIVNIPAIIIPKL